MAAAFIACGLIVADCATDATSGGSVDLYGGFYYDDGWYGGGGCCLNYPDDIGPPPHPEHPIAKPPVQPSQPIAKPPAPSQPIASRPMPSPRPSMGGGGGGRRR